MDTIVVPKIVFKSNVLSHVVFEEVQSQLIQQLRAIPDVQKFKHSSEFIQLICTIIESTIKKKHNVDKKQLVIRIILRLFDLRPEEETRISDEIDFLLRNKLVKKARHILLRKTAHVVSKLLRKK